MRVGVRENVFVVLISNIVTNLPLGIWH